MRKNLRFLVFLLLVTALTVACQKPPQAETDTARQAVAGAESAEAGTYASSELETAQAAIRAAETEIETQNQKFALFRNYDEAKRLLADAQAKAGAAREAAVAGKERAKSEAEAELANAEAKLGEAATLLDELAACPRKPKGFEADLEALRGRLEGLQSQTQGIRDAVAGEKYFAAKASATELQEQVEPFITDLAGAKEKIRC